MALKDTLITLFAGAIESVGESKLVDVLQELHDTKPDVYKAVIDGGTALVEGLQSTVDNSPNKIDDAILKAISEAIATSTKNNATA